LCTSGFRNHADVDNYSPLNIINIIAFIDIAAFIELIQALGWKVGEGGRGGKAWSAGGTEWSCAQVPRAKAGLSTSSADAHTETKPALKANDALTLIPSDAHLISFHSWRLHAFKPFER
jgi:hypothetical protein